MHYYLLQLKIYIYTLKTNKKMIIFKKTAFDIIEIVDNKWSEKG